MEDLITAKKRWGEIWTLTILFMLALIIAVVILITPVKISLGGGRSMVIDTVTLRLGALGIFLLVVLYIFQNQVRNWKIFRTPVEDSVSIGVLDRRISELSELNRVSKAVTSVMDIQALYRIIMESVLKLMKADNFSLLMRDEEHLTIKAARGLDDAIVSSARVRMGEGIAGWVAERCEPVIINGPVHDERFRKLVSHEKRILSSLSVPVGFRGEVFGVMCVSNISRPYTFTENDLRLLSIFSDQVAIALENNRLFAKLTASLEELKGGQEQLIQAAKLSALGQLISGITHELNNRLSPIIGYTELLLDRSQECDTGRYIDTIYRSAVGARKLLKSLSSFSKEREATMEYVDLNEIMEKVAGMMAYQFDVSGIHVEKELDENLPCTMADPFQLEEVFFNILKNALLSMEASPGGLKLRSGTHHGRIVVEVSDEGIGIPEEHLPRIFDPFFTTREGDRGTGLGLSVCYGIIKLHGGDISISSRAGGGTTVRIELPVREMEGAVFPPVKRGEEVGELSALRILVVDDEEVVRQLLLDILSKDNSVEAVGTVAEALRAMEESEFDLIIADVLMPKVDGIQFYRKVSEMSPSLSNRILFITGDATSLRFKEFLKKTGRRCISKPFSVKELLQVCKSLVESSSP